MSPSSAGIIASTPSGATFPNPGGLIVRYSADYEKTQYANGAQIATLHDISGNALHAAASATAPLMRYTGGNGNAAYLDVDAQGKGWSIPDLSAFSAAANGVHCFLDIYAYNNGRGPFKAWSSDQYFTFSDGHVYSDFYRGNRRGPINVVSLGKPVVTTWRRLQFVSKTGSWKFLLDETLMDSDAGNYDETTDNGGNIIWFGSWNNAGNPNGYRFGGLYLFDHELTGTDLTNQINYMIANPGGGL